MPRPIVALTIALALGAAQLHSARADEKDPGFESLRVWTYEDLEWVEIDGQGRLSLEITRHPRWTGQVSPYLLARISAEARHVYARVLASSRPRERITVRLPDGTPKPAPCAGQVPRLEINEGALPTADRTSPARVVVAGTQHLIERADGAALFALVSQAAADVREGKTTRPVTGRIETGRSGEVFLVAQKRVRVEADQALLDVLGTFQGKTLDLVLRGAEDAPVATLVELPRARPDGAPLLVRGVGKDEQGNAAYRAYDPATHRRVKVTAAEAGLPELAIVSEPCLPATCGGVVDALGGKRNP